MEFKYKLLKGRIVSVFGTQGEFAKELGVTENTVSRKLNSSVDFSRDDIIKWSDLLEIEKDDIGKYFFA